MPASHKIFDYLNGLFLFNNGGLSLICLLALALVWALAKWIRREAKPDSRIPWEALRRVTMFALALPPIVIGVFYASALMARVGHMEDVAEECVLGVNTTLSRHWDGFHKSYTVVAGGEGYRFSASWWGDGLGRREPFPIRPQTMIAVHTLFEHVVRVDQVAGSCGVGAPEP